VTLHPKIRTQAVLTVLYAVLVAVQGAVGAFPSATWARYVEALVGPLVLLIGGWVTPSPAPAPPPAKTGA
jgi:hypothetical protein